MTNEYFQSDEFREKLESYEQQKDKGRSIYMDAEDYADIADYYLNREMTDNAEKAIEQGLAIHPDDEGLLAVKSASRIMQYRFDEAEQILAELDYGDSDVKYQQAQIQYAKYKDIDAAECLWREWLSDEAEENPDEASRRDCYIHVISSFVELRDDSWNNDAMWNVSVEAARRWVEEYIKLFHPLGAYETDIQVADICRDNEFYDLLAEVLTQVLNERPYMKRGWTTLGLAHFMQNDFEQALEACDFAIAVDGEDQDAMLTKAHSLHTMKAYKEACEAFKAYFEHGGDIIQKIPYADSLLYVGRTDEAIEQLKEVTAYSLSEEGEADLGSMERKPGGGRLDDFNRHDRYYNSVAELKGRIMSDIGEVYSRHSRYEESLESYKRAHQYVPDDPDVYFMMGMCYLSLSQYEPATHEFSQALKYADDPIMMGVDIALTFVINNYDSLGLEVLDAVEKLGMLRPSSFLDNIPAARAIIYLKLGQNKQFIASFREACNKTPELVDNVFNGYFPKNLSVKQWSDYAEENFDTLLRNFSKGTFPIEGFY